MYRRYGQFLSVVFLGCDLLVTAAAWLAAYVLALALPAPYGVPNSERVLAALPVILALSAVAYRVCGLYEIHRLRQLPRELGEVCKASGLLFLLAIVVIFYRRDVYESRAALALFFALNVLGLTLARRGLWWMLREFRSHGLNRGRALVVGSGRAARRVEATLQQNPWTALEVVGYVDRQGANTSQTLPRLGDLDELPKLVDANDIDHVFLALPMHRYGELTEVWRQLSGLFVEVQLVPDVPGISGMRIRTLEIDDVGFVGLREDPHTGWNGSLKRGMDLVLGGLATMLLAPLMLLLALAVKMTSRGPVLFRQPRIGLNGRPFNMLKFRSMRVDAERSTGAVWAVPNDSRCTPLGRLMRRWSLDELPQLFNVLAGHMSLVGPRPERDVFCDRFARCIPDYAQRHQVKTGITGWAQVNGWRGNTSWRRRLEFDLYYINHWSPWLDLKILLLTPLRGLRHRNAY